jgi:hypothetical protein
MIVIPFYSKQGWHLELYLKDRFLQLLEKTTLFIINNLYIIKPTLSCYILIAIALAHSTIIIELSDCVTMGHLYPPFCFDGNQSFTISQRALYYELFLIYLYTSTNVLYDNLQLHLVSSPLIKVMKLSSITKSPCENFSLVKNYSFLQSLII